MLCRNMSIDTFETFGETFEFKQLNTRDDLAALERHSHRLAVSTSRSTDGITFYVTQVYTGSDWVTVIA